MSRRKVTRRPKRSPLAALLLLTLTSAPVLAQRDNDPLQGTFFEVTGQVRLPGGRTTANDLPVRLELYGGALVDQATTDSVGRFRFTRLRRAQYTVVVRVPGYREERQSVDISVVGRAHVILQLTPEGVRREAAAEPEVVDAKTPPEARAEYEKGVAAMNQGKAERAVAHLERAVKIYPAFFAAQALLGKVHMDASAWDKAEGALGRAREVKPQDVPVLVLLGEVHRRRHHFDKAEAVLREAVKLDDQSWQGHFTLGRVYFEAGDMGRAGQHTGRTLQLRPGLAEAHLLGGNIFMRAGLPENALIEYEEYLRLAPGGEFSAQVKLIVQKLKTTAAEKKP